MTARRVRRTRSGEPANPEFDGDQAAIELDAPELPDPASLTSGDGPLDADYENVFTNDSAADATPTIDPADAGWSQVRGAGARFDDEALGIEQNLSRGITLKEHLLGQLNVALDDPVDRIIGAYLFEILDESGYLTETTEEIAGKLGAELGRVEAVLSQLQTFDPPGIGARDLAECLALQLKERDRFDPAMQAFLDNLPLLAKHDIQGLMRVCQVDTEDITEMIAEIKALNPKPGLTYDYEVAQPVIPDVFVRERRDGGWLIELNTDTLPKVLVNARYCSLVETMAKSGSERAYLTECINNANWLVKSLDQRARTILKVATEIVRQQDAFLARGVQHLRPLNLRAIAEAIDMHESTVSRVTANKYMATPRGIFELRYFFTAAIASSEGGEAHSAEAVRHRIRALIDAEGPKSVLSDDRLVELLRELGINIARRTVAKYREALGIPSSVQRRRSKRLSV